MTAEAQRIAIAEACGWRHQKGEEPVYGGSFEPAGWVSPAGRFHRTKWNPHGRKSAIGLPDYLHDLNAMHDALLSLPEDLRAIFNAKLFMLVKGGINPHWMFDALTANADKLAEAYLRTIGKWIEE